MLVCLQVGQIRERIAGIQREYEELDTVWFMAGSLFKNYPFEPPTEQFSLEVFTQAFAAVQSSVVHLQVRGGGSRRGIGVLGRRV